MERIGTLLINTEEQVQILVLYFRYLANVFLAIQIARNARSGSKTAVQALTE